MKKILAFCILLFLNELVHGQAPVILSFSPTSAKPGDLVNITGTGFNAAAVSNIVFFGSTRATVINASSTNLTVTVPAGAKYAPISVLNTNNNLIAYSSYGFNSSYTPPKATINASDFSAPISFSNGSSSGKGTVSDLDGDGKPDLIVFSPSSTLSISILRNIGSIGTVNFEPSINLNAASFSYTLTVGDVDGDGKPDLILPVPAAPISYISVFRNTSTIGNISFAPRVDMNMVGAEPWDIAVGDLNGDGKLDLATANGSVVNPNSVSTLINNSTVGNINFSMGPQLAVTARSLPRSIAIVDINGDGKPDIATANHFDNTVSVFLNIGSGTFEFAAKVDFTTGARPLSLIAGDIDGDGKLDLVMACGNEAAFSVLHNKSNLINIDFDPVQHISTGYGPYSVSIGDINGDGKPDISVANGGSNGGAGTFNVSTHINSSIPGGISFLPGVQFFTNGMSALLLGVVDLDGDTKPEIATGTGNANLTLVFRNTDIITNKKYVNDNSLSADVFTTAIGNDANAGTASSPFATITKALSVANEGDTVYVDAGTYAEQAIIDKGITIIGAGANLTSFITPSTPLVPPPGAFTEIGLFETTQGIGDVHIADLSITCQDQNIIIQSGGSVKNCKLIGGGQGVYFRVESAIKSALIENNFIEAQYIGINCQGSGLSASLINNTINLTNPYFAAGIFAGLDFGPLVRFTALGNAINNYNAQGFLANSYNTNITQNSILGTQGPAIQQGTNSLAFATCNWFGTTNAATIASKVSGFFSYTPFLNNGTDISPANGFQPTPGACGEGVTNFYVNDNSRMNDVFTTAVGNNSNPGTSTAPFATLSYAISVAPANSVIHVDAGTYTEQVIIDRGIVINGAGRELTLFVKPSTTLVPAPGPFTEIGLFETTQGIGDVHIRNLSINSIDGTSQNVIIQSGGSVKNCKLLNGGQGVFFRYESGSKNAAVEFNIIQPNGIGINCQGGGLSANIVNNTISNTTQYYAGIFAGLDFGPLAQLTITNNFINNYGSYTGPGILANSNSSNITNNSITGTPGPAIQQTSGNALNATCNWYGSPDQNIVVPKIQGAVNYSPWLTDGTDNSSDQGFQPVPGACNGRQSNFYVNDNNQAGDVFTTAVGNNGNTGLSSAPFATLNRAIASAQAGDIIYVDAGTYIENVIVNKSVTLRGAKYGQQPGASLDRGNESIVIPAVANLNLTGGSIIRAGADNITIDGFTLNGDNPNLNSGTLVNGVDVNAATAVFNDGLIAAYLTVKNNIVKNTGTYGIGLFRTLGTTTGPVVPGALFTQNRVDNIGGRGIVLAYSAYGDITNNHISRCNSSGTWFSQQNVANINNNISSISGNLIEQCPLGMQSSSISAAASFIQYFNNEILGTGLPNGIGVSMLINAGAGISFYNNKISNIGGDAFYSSNPSAGTPLWVYNNSFNSISGRLFNNSQAVPLNADCNWLDGTNGSLIAAKVTGNVSYIPWLTDNTDTDPATRGFQPRAGVCNGTPVTITLSQATNINCFGQNTGAIDITVAGGTVPYSFAWTKTSDPGFTASTKDISGLTAGTYHVVLTDTYNSTASLDVILSEPPAALSISLTGTNITCFGNNNGNIIANVNGGTTPYIYQWSNGGTASSISELAGGGYTVVVNDANGCNVSTGYNVLEPALLTVTITGTTASCNGSATAAAAGGTSSYTYLWSTGATTSSISNVPAGLYTLTVTDANGCIANGSYTITGNSNINPSTAIVNVSCFGTATGSITVTGAGGVAPRTYNINGSPFQANNVFSNLPAGVYVVGVKDANGCSDFVTRTITQPALLTVVLDSVRSACFGVNNGRIDITAGGGSGGKTYNWTGPNGFTSTTQDPNNIAGGMYALTVTDSKGCTANLSVLVPTWNEITLTESVTNIACRGGNSGAINITVSGGTGSGFGFSWTGPGGFIATTEDISGLLSGNYKITVTDLGSGCTLIKTIVVSQPAANLNISTSKTNATGCNSLGTITATGSGGTNPYQYSINGTTFQASGLFTGLYAGDFTVWVKDGNGCTQTKIVSITDNGRDEYEGNNNKNQAKTINTGANIFARIASITDSADWFKFTTGNGGNYVLTLTHPNTSFVFNMYPSGNNTPALVPVNSNATSKEYTLAANTEYFINVTGGYSYICYTLLVNENVQSLITGPSPNGNYDTKKIKNKEIADKRLTLKLSSVVYPNPHQGSFTLQINAPESGLAVIQLITAEGRILSASNKILVKGNANTVNFSNIPDAILFYRIMLGKQIITGKVIRQS